MRVDTHDGKDGLEFTVINAGRQAPEATFCPVPLRRTAQNRPSAETERMVGVRGWGRAGKGAHGPGVLPWGGRMCGS